MINVLYCGDSLGWYGMEASIYSLLTHNKNVNIYIFSMDYERENKDGSIEKFEGVLEWQKEKLRKIVQYLDPKGSRITFIDTLSYYEKYFKNGCNENDGHSSPYAPLRLIVDVVFPHLPHILYLDCDTIIQDAIEDMYYSVLKEIEAEKNIGYAARVLSFHDRDEMVAGVLLFDLNKTREIKLLEKARYNITHNFYMWYDQSALEAAGGCVRLAETYNYMNKYEYRTYTPTILHFADQLDPKVYFEREVFFNKFPHLQYIKTGCDLVGSLTMKVKGE